MFQENEKEKLFNPFNHILIPRLFERKQNKTNNEKDFLNKKRNLEKLSGSKKRYLKIN